MKKVFVTIKMRLLRNRIISALNEIGDEVVDTIAKANVIIGDDINFLRKLQNKYERIIFFNPEGSKIIVSGIECPDIKFCFQKSLSGINTSIDKMIQERKQSAV